jgi:hypothetical protein
MLDLKTKADLQRLVDEGIEESITLDYKVLLTGCQFSARLPRMFCQIANFT